MTNGDFKKILDESLKPVREDLKEVKETLQDHTRRLEDHTKILEDHTRRLEALAGDSEQLLMDVKGIRDKEGMAHSRNKREIDEIKTHLELPLMPDIPEV